MGGLKLIAGRLTAVVLNVPVWLWGAIALATLTFAWMGIAALHGRKKRRATATTAETEKAISKTADQLVADETSVRVFVSSTFLDMQRERDLLVKNVFPALRERMRTRGVELLAVDLRWGITKEQAQRGETLPTLLAEIDRCRPYFIGLLGDRYGWVPPASALTQELRASYPSIAGASGRSVTEMEILHGVLRNPATAARSFFFERDASWDWRATLSEADRTNIAAEGEEDQVKLSKLKAEIRGCVPRVQMYREPSELAQVVLEVLGKALDERFPEGQAPDAFTLTARLHTAYARERRRLYVGSQAYRAALDQWMEKQNAPPLLIGGASGGGKSTLIANWINAWRTAHPNDLVFEHYLGASPDSANPMLVMRRLWEFLNRVTGEEVNLPSGNVDLAGVASGLALRVDQAKAFAERGGGRVLIALDGLDKLHTEQNLHWVPSVAGVKLLVSSLDGEAKSAGRLLGWHELDVKPLTNEQRRQFVVGTLANWGRNLQDEDASALMNGALSGSPLFLKTVLEELRLSATNAVLRKRLDHYLQALDMPDLFSRVLTRLDQDCEPGLAEKALQLIWASRSGLEEAQILAITDATPLAWATLRNALGDGLRDQGGRIAFSHDFLNQAVANRYVGSDEKKRAVHLALADHFEARPPDVRQIEELPFQLRAAEEWDRLTKLLTDLDRFVLLRSRGNVEMMGYWAPLQSRGTDLEWSLYRAFTARAGEEEITDVDRGFGAAGLRRASEAKHWTRADLDLALEIGDFLRFAGATGIAEEQMRESLVHASERLLGAEHPLTLWCLNLDAERFARNGQYDFALERQKRVFETMKRVCGPEDPNTLASAGRLAQMLRAGGEQGAARALQDETYATCVQVLGQDHAETLNAAANLALTIRANGRLEEAQGMQEEVLERRLKLLGSEHPDVVAAKGDLAATLRERGQLERARQMEDAVLNYCKRTFGPTHPVTIRASDNLAETLLALGEVGLSQMLTEKVLEVGRERASFVEIETSERRRARIEATLGELGYVENSGAHRKRALEIHQQVFWDRFTRLGVRHPETVQSMDDVAAALDQLQDAETPREFHERILNRVTEDTKANLNAVVEREAELLTPADKPYRLTDESLKKLISGSLSDAEAAQIGALEHAQRVFGEKDVHTVESRLLLEEVFAARDRFSASLQ